MVVPLDPSSKASVIVQLVCMFKRKKEEREQRSEFSGG